MPAGHVDTRLPLLFIRQLEDMLSKLQPQGDSSGITDCGQQGEADTATLHDTTERLQGQHLSGQEEGAEGAAFTTPAGASWPQGRSPANGVSYHWSEAF